MMGVYAIANRANGRMYVGSAKNIEVRWQQHRTMLRNGTHHSFYLQRAWDKYGESAFILQVLEQIEDASDLRAAEQRWMDFLGGPGGRNSYNVHPVAAGGQMPGYTPSAETLAKLGNASRGERNHTAKLTEAQVREIHARFVAGETIDQIAPDYGVHRTTVAYIVRGASWKHLHLPRTNFVATTGKLRRDYRLTFMQVADIKRRLDAGETRAALVKEYGVSHGTIDNIATGRRKTPDI